MRVSKEKAEENRIALLDAASFLFRKKGIAGVGVAEIAEAADLTHGALYAHFKSKDELAAAALAHGFRGRMTEIKARAGDRRHSFQDYIAGLLSTQSRDKLETGCPLAASACEIARQDRGVSTSFTDAFNEMVDMVEASLEKDIPKSKRRRLALTTIVVQIGANAASRGIKKADAALADEILEASREIVRVAHKAELARSK